MTIAKIKTLSICPCGFPLFNDEIKLGMEYEVDPLRTSPNSSVQCGGCGNEIPSTFIWLIRRMDLAGIRQMPGYAPSEAFSLHEPAKPT